MRVPETEIKARILLEAGSLPGVRLFNNPVGVAYAGSVLEWDRRARVLVLKEPRTITYGLCPGSSDIIGLRQVRITAAHVGNTIGQFVGLEVKTDRGTSGDLQVRFGNMVLAYGGFSNLVRSPADAVFALATENY